MTRGKKPEAAIAEAKNFAERMGYFPIDNPHEDLPFDILIFKRESDPGGKSAADPVPYRSKRILRTAVPGGISRDFAAPVPPVYPA